MIIAVAVTVCDTAGAASGFRDTIKVERDYQDPMLYKTLRRRVCPISIIHSQGCVGGTCLRFLSQFKYSPLYFLLNTITLMFM